MPHPEREHELMIEVARRRRENERLDRTLASAFEDLHAEQRRAETAQEALAAARRECEVAKEAREYCLHMFPREWLTDPANRSIFAACIFAILDGAALAAPAAGEDGTR